MKNMTLGLMLALSTSACSHKTESNTVIDTPKFQITASEVSSASVQPVVSGKTGRKTAELDVVFSKTDGFVQFAREHMNQRVQFFAGTNLVVETKMSPEIAKGGLELSCSTLEKAQRIADSLRKR